MASVTTSHGRAAKRDEDGPNVAWPVGPSSACDGPSRVSANVYSRRALRSGLFRLAPFSPQALPPSLLFSYCSLFSSFLPLWASAVFIIPQEYQPMYTLRSGLLRLVASPLLSSFLFFSWFFLFMAPAVRATEPAEYQPKTFRSGLLRFLSPSPSLIF